MRLGRLPHDPHRLAAAPVHTFGVLALAPSLDRSAVDFVPGLYGNDTLPDCTAVALINAARGTAALAGYDLAVDSVTVPAFYGACIGNPPDLAATDGAEIISVLEYQDAHGFSIGPQMLVGLWGTVSLDRPSLALSVVDIAYWGVTLRERDMQRAAVWDVQSGRDDGDVVGGHAVIAWDYAGLGDDDTVRIGTWGGWQPATWAWVAARLDEAHAVRWPQLARAV